MKLVLCILFFISTAASAKNKKIFESGDEKISLLELYSSEGCSSCPPAEKQLYALKSDSNLWKKFVAINFHVDYWNQLGWVDRFSKDKFTERQRNYAKFLDVQRIYTPQFILDGADAGSALVKNFLKAQSKSGQMILNIDDTKVKVTFKPEKMPNKKYEIYFALLGNGLQSKVMAGENKGELLRHNFVVLSLMNKKAELISDAKNSIYEANFDLNKDYSSSESMSVVAWVTEENSMKSIQALGGDL